MDIALQTNGFQSWDIHQTVAIHCREISQGFLTSLGHKPLEIVFAHIAHSQFGVLITAGHQESDTICGFVCGATDTGALYRDFLIRRTLPALFYFAPKLLGFQTLRKAFETLTYPARQKADLPDAELLVLAVSREYWGKGVAQKLFAAFVSRLRARGIKKFRIGTGTELTRAQQFYEKQGAKQAISTQIHKGENALYYVYTIGDQTP